jgi:hypothetical protein
VVRRSLFALVAAALLAVPSTAVAEIYPAPETEVTLADPAPAAGQAFDVGISGPPGADATLNISSPDTASPEDVTIAGEKELTKTIPGDGVAPFTVTLNAPGTYTLTGLVDGEVVARQTVTVRESATAVTALGAEAGEPGSPIGPLVLGGLGLAVLAAVLVLVVRRRRAEGGGA